MFVCLIHHTPSTSPDRSTLVNLLAQLTASKVSSAERNLALHLSRLIGVNDSIALASSLRQLPAVLIESNVHSAVSVQEDVLASRERMLNVISQSFTLDAELSPIHVPSLSAGIKIEALLNYQLYQRFFTTHQIEMAAGVQSLRLRVRKALSAFSLDMHKLAELDRVVDQSLANQTRRLFSVTPKLLEQRFELLRAGHFEQPNQEALNDGTRLSDWLAPDGWLAIFYDNMRELLFAELDVRLQPVLGLLEALNEQVTQHHD